MIKQPTLQQEQELLEINDDWNTVINIPGRNSVKVGYMRPYTTERLSKLMLQSKVKLSDGDEMEALELTKTKGNIPARLASLVILNRMWKIRLFHWAHWRWIAKVQEWTFNQCLPIIIAGKKKIPLAEFEMCIMLGVAMMETTRTMTTKEVEQYRQELLLAQEQHLQKSTLGQ